MRLQGLRLSSLRFDLWIRPSSALGPQRGGRGPRHSTGWPPARVEDMQGALLGRFKKRKTMFLDMDVREFWNSGPRSRMARPASLRHAGRTDFLPNPRLEITFRSALPCCSLRRHLQMWAFSRGRPRHLRIGSKRRFLPASTGRSVCTVAAPGDASSRRRSPAQPKPCLETHTEHVSFPWRVGPKRGTVNGPNLWAEAAARFPLDLQFRSPGWRRPKCLPNTR